MRIQKNYRLEQEVVDDIRFIQQYLYENERIYLNDTETVSHAIRKLAQELKTKKPEE